MHNYTAKVYKNQYIGILVSTNSRWWLFNGREVKEKPSVRDT